MRLFWCAVLVLAGCDMGGPAFIGLEPMRISVGGSDFTVRQRNDRAGGGARRARPRTRATRARAGPRSSSA